MTESKTDFWMILNEEEQTQSKAGFKIPITPDTKGPKTIAIFLILGALLIGFMAYQDYNYSQLEDIPDSDVEQLLETPNSQDGVNITDEQLQNFHDDARDSGAYVIRATSLFASSVLLFVGAIYLLQLRAIGSILATIGASIGFVGGILGSYLVNEASVDNLAEPLLLTYELFMYLCGVCMFVCTAFAALPLVNARSRAALKNSNRVELFTESE